MADGVPLFAAESGDGMGTLSPEDYPGALTSLLAPYLPTPEKGLPVVICGMAGARQGWAEADYLETSADLRELGRRAVHPPVGDLPYSVSILSGVCQRQPEDVMRGEEIQLLGLSILRPGFDGLVCMPGTHSKWAQLDGTILASFSTVMTGELFALLRSHSVLRHTTQGDLIGPDTEAGVEAGLTAGQNAPDRLTSLLFRARSASLLSGKQPDWCSGYLSGLLVGAETAARRDSVRGQSVPVIGSPRLTRIYCEALKRVGAEPDPVDPTESVLAGLRAAKEHIPV
jgi:2-dehydro-3-deoxygalactonokinase